MVEKRIVIQLRVSPTAYEAVKRRALAADKTVAEMLREMLRYAEQRMPK